FVHAPRVGHGDNFRPVSSDLPSQLFDVFAGRERGDAESFRQRFHHIEALPADGACRTQDGDALQLSCPPFYGSSIRRVPLLPAPADEQVKIVPDPRRGNNQSIDPVPHPPLSPPNPPAIPS